MPDTVKSVDLVSSLALGFEFWHLVSSLALPVYEFRFVILVPDTVKSVDHLLNMETIQGHRPFM